MKTRYKIISIGIILGVIISGIGAVNISKYIHEQEWLETTKKLEELSRNGIIIKDSDGPGKNIVSYKFGILTSKPEVLQVSQELLNEKEGLINQNLDRIGYDERSVPITSWSINQKWGALEIGIDPNYMIKKENLSNYFDIIRKIVGNEINIVLKPEYQAIPLEN